jgi:hypothetical protein
MWCDEVLFVVCLVLLSEMVKKGRYSSALISLMEKSGVMEYYLFVWCY